MDPVFPYGIQLSYFLVQSQVDVLYAEQWIAIDTVQQIPGEMRHGILAEVPLVQDATRNVCDLIAMATWAEVLAEVFTISVTFHIT